jgi:hypothetical protein
MRGTHKKGIFGDLLLHIHGNLLSVYTFISFQDLQVVLYLQIKLSVFYIYICIHI